MPEGNTTNRQGVEAEPRRSLIASATAWLAAAILLAAAIFVILGRLESSDWYPWNNVQRPDLYDLTRSTIAFTGLLGAAIAASIAIRRQRSNEMSVRISALAQATAAEAYALEVDRHALARDRASQERLAGLRDRYTAAAAQLGDNSPAIRLAGVYAMAVLADEWLALSETLEAQACIDVLCGYLRTPRQVSDSSSTAERLGDLEVRQTIIRTVADRLNPTSARQWSGRRFDFTGAEFDGRYTFDGATFADSDVSFRAAVFSGGVFSFRKCVFSGGEIDFRDCRFVGARMEFAQAAFTGSRVNFIDTIFDGSGVSFWNASFESDWVDFEDAKIKSGYLSFDGVKFSAEVGFQSVKVTGGSLRFSHCTFQPEGVLWLFGCKISAGAVSLTDSKSTGGWINLKDWKISGGSLTIERLTSERGGFPEDWQTRGLPERWPAR